MLPTKTRHAKTERFIDVLLMCFCLGVVMAVSCIPKNISRGTETAAEGIGAQASPTVTPQDPRDSEARQALARGEELRADWTAVSFRQAIENYEKAALLWTSISDFRNASEATLKAGDVYFLLSDYAQALKRYQDVEAAARTTGNWLVQATALSQTGRIQSYFGKNDLAEKQISQALDLFKRHEGNPTVIATNPYGETLINLAEVYYAKGNVLKASQQIESALTVFRNYPKGKARAHLFRGHIAGTIGQTDKAAVEISHALELYREINDKSGEGLALTALGLWHSSDKNQSRAIQMNGNARDIFRAIGDQYSEAIALNAIGQAHEILSQYPDALYYYKSALALFENIGAVDAATGTTCAIASTQLGNKDMDQALIAYERCLKLSRSAGKLRIQAHAINGIAMIYGAQRRQDLAVKQYQKLEKFFKSQKDFRGLAMALNGHGEFFLQLGENKKALDVFSQAFSLSEKMDDKGILLSTFYNLARANEALGHHETALSLVKQSFKLIEEVRANIGSPYFRATYFAAVKKHYDLRVEILMQLEKLRPGEGFAAEALSVNEQSQARLLLDLLSESRPRIHVGTARELVENELRLRGLLQAQAEYQLNLSLSGKESSEIAEVAGQITQLSSEYQVVQAQLREQNPSLFSFEEFAAVDLTRIQRELRDSDTMLLEYALGDERSYLWAVTSNSSHSYVLPDRKTIEDVSRELYETITARQRTDGQSDNAYQTKVAAADKLYDEKSSHLSQMLLGPVAEQLGRRRLVIVAKGALQYIPFDALPKPPTQTADHVNVSRTPLVETNEVVVLPSASTLIAIRAAQKNKDSSGKLVAIIADPVFSPSDDRVQSEAAADQNTDQAEQQAIENLKLARLIHASAEADSISAIAPWGTTFVAKDFDASRETAMSSEVSRAQIVHFATHGFLNSERPELSSIVLTMTAPNGAKTNGLMTLPDIYSLDLSAELTVLSACQTALGKEIKGEGLVGLTHSFMSAGSKSVVASLWNVDDRATAALMADFYDGMLRERMTPSAALRSAKLKMMRTREWSAPFYWAGFVLQGEYTNHIAVNRRSWRSPGLVLLSLLALVSIILLIIQIRKRRLPPRQFT